MPDVQHIFYNSLSLPVVAAPMFLISGPKLVTTCCRSGIIGTLPALNQRSSEGFDQWLTDIENDLNSFENETGRKPAPYGVNLIVHRTNPRLQADLDICVKHQVPIVITSLGAVSDLVKKVHGYGGLVFHDVTNRRHSEKAMEAGVDGLILVSAGAGGHAGLLNPMPFIQEIRSFFDGIILLSGCMSNGGDVASAMQMGADLAYLGTRFINTDESRADDDYKHMIMESKTSDIVYTAAVSGVHANFLRPSLEAMGITQELWGIKKKIDFGSELDAQKAEAKAWKTIWSAGQGVATINTESSPVEELVRNMKNEFHEAIDRQLAFKTKFA
ncbi:MAG: nitronate monooxygenase family protein [Bacteroidia bacterium]|nr:nitronate monooxygenase family protein [Bacteroidia bacterium]